MPSISSTSPFDVIVRIEFPDILPSTEGKNILVVHSPDNSPNSLEKKHQTWQKIVNALFGNLVDINAGVITVGETGNLATQQFEFNVPSTSWSLNHNLGRKPIVQVLIDNQVVDAIIEHIDNNNLVVTFYSEQVGQLIIL